MPDSYGEVYAAVKLNGDAKSEIHVKKGMEFKGVKMVDVRKHIDTGKFKGYTKEGVAIPYAKFPEFVAALVKLHNELLAGGEIQK